MEHYSAVKVAVRKNQLQDKLLGEKGIVPKYLYGMLVFV